MKEQTHNSFDVALPAESSLADLMSNKDGLNAMIDNLEKVARSTVTDISTAEGRDAVKSLAYKIAQSKTALDKAGLASTEAMRAKVKTTNELRTIAKDRLAALQAEVRKPLTEWEAAEEQRKEAMEQRLAGIDKGRVDAGSSSAAIRAAIAEITAIEVGEDWGDFQTQAEFLKGDALDHFAALLPISEKREADAAELEQLRAMKAEQERRDAEALAEKQRADAEAAAEREKAEQAEAQRVAAENAATAERERAERAAQEAEKRHAEEVERAKMAERERIASEQAAADAERERQLADTKRAAKVMGQIEAAIGAMKDQSPSSIAAAIYAGQIPNVTIKN